MSKDYNLTSDEKTYILRVAHRCNDWMDVLNKLNDKFGNGRGLRTVQRLCRARGVVPLGAQRRQAGTLCWHCIHCSPNHQIGDLQPRNGEKVMRGCEWSLRGKGITEGKPVPGWDAEPTMVYTTGKSEPSYFVHSCPKFQKERVKHGKNN